MKIEVIDGQKTILTNEEAAELVYTFDLEDVDLFSSTFVMAFATLLGSMVAPDILGFKVGRSVSEKMLTEYLSMVGISEGTDSNQEKPPAPEDPEWITAR